MERLIYLPIQILAAVVLAVAAAMLLTIRLVMGALVYGFALIALAAIFGGVILWLSGA